MRKVAYPLRLARARLVAGAERFLIVCLGIAAGAALLAAVLGGSLAAQDRSVSRAAARLTADHGSVRTTWGGVSGVRTNAYGGLDRFVRRSMSTARLREPVAAMLLRETEFGGHLVQLGAIDGVGRFVHLRSGRLPRACTPDRCEVVQIGGVGTLPSVPGLRLVRVGRASLESRLPFGDLLASSRYGTVFATAVLYHEQAAVPLVLTEGVSGLARSPALDGLYRSYIWAVPLQRGAVHPWSVDHFAARVTHLRSDLANVSPLFDVVAPTAELNAAAASGRVSGHRLDLLGGEAATLLLAFTLLAAASLRRDVDAAWRRLTWFGARRWQLAVLTGAESAAVALVGTIVGWSAGVGVTVLVARNLSAPAWPVLVHSALSWTGLGIAVGLGLVATVVLLAALRLPALHLGGLAVSALDVAALGALLAVVLALVRGTAGSESLSGRGGTGLFLLLLPGLVVFVAGVVAARALVPTLRLLERVGQRGPVALRLAALSLARGGGRASVAVTFLVASLGLALFAQAYRATLTRGQTDQAAYAVPAPLVLREDLTKLVSVPQAAPLASYRGLGARPLPVLRFSGDVRRLNSSGFTLLGIPAAAIPRTGGWRSDFATQPLRALADRLRPRVPTGLRGARLPRTAHVLTIPVSGRGDPLTVTANVETPRGTFVGVELGQTSPRRTLRAVLPAAARGGKLIGLAFGLTNTTIRPLPESTNVAPIARGRAVAGPLEVDGRPLHAGLGQWFGVGGVAASSAGDRVSFRYLLTNDFNSRLRPRQATDGSPPAVLASPDLAAAAGGDHLLPVFISGQPLTVRVAGTVRRFPSVDGDVIVGDERTLATALNSDAPGSAVVDEVWLETNRPDTVERALRQPPWSALALSSLHDRTSLLRGEPLARGTLVTLAAAALAALVLALVGLVLELIGDLRDESGELHDLEAQGADPATLRRHLRLRTLAIAGFGLAGGIVTGIVLGALVVDIVRLTANAGAPQPPLVLVVGWPVALLAIAAYAVAAVALAVLATTGAFRAPEAGRYAEASS